MNAVNVMKQYRAVQDLYVLRGDLPMPVGAVTDTENGFTYAGDGYTLTTVLETHPSGVVKRTDCVVNTSDHPIDLRAALTKFVFNGGEYEVYTQYCEWCDESEGLWQPLNTSIGAAAEETRLNCVAAPFMALYNCQTGRGTAFHILADGLWQLRASRHFTHSGMRKTVTVELGLSERDFSYILQPGETFTFAPILFYEFRNKQDMDAYKLHRYCDDVYPPRSFPIIYDSWMSHFDRISYEQLSAQLERAARIGAEYFVVDAGWFGAPDVWFNAVGDWEEHPDAGTYGKLAQFADDVRAKGLMFGLWFEIERASSSAKVVQEYPQYYVEQNGHAFVNFADPAACDHIYRILADRIDRYGIRFIKFDFNAPYTWDNDHVSFRRYFEGYKSFIRRIGEEHPEVYLENCASGGLRMALCALDGFDSFWISDNHSLNMELRIFKDTILRMPPRALEKWLTIRSEENFRGAGAEKIFMSGNCDWTLVEGVTPSFLSHVAVGGPIGISCDLTGLSEERMNTLAEEIRTYKAEADFWMHAECRILADTETLTALQFSDRNADTVKIYAYSKFIRQNSLTLYPVCDTAASYRRDDGTVYTGARLDEDGVEIWYTGRYAAAAVTFTKIK